VISLLLAFPPKPHMHSSFPPMRATCSAYDTEIDKRTWRVKATGSEDPGSRPIASEVTYDTLGSHDEEY
jgi:hypothetical protein